jgi:hypothetical protein
MKFSKFLVLIQLILISHTSVAQEKYILSLSPAIMMPGGVIAVQPGMGFNINDEWKLQADVAFAQSRKSNDRFEKTSFFRTSLEIKTLAGIGAYYDKYVSLQLAYNIRTLNDLDSGNFKSARHGAADNSYSSAIIKSPVFSMALKTGREYEIGERFIVDVFTGLGFRTIFTNYKPQGLHPNTFVPTPLPFSGNPAWKCNCTQSRFHFVTGIRVGVKL